MKKMVGLILTVIAVLSGCAQATSGDSPFVNETYIPAGFSWEKPETMLVLGNSICQIPGEWGMSASSPEKDYVHLLAGKIGCTFTARNSWDIEQSYEEYDFSSLPDADMIIIQLGDNMEKHYSGYSEYLAKLIKRYDGKTVVLTSTIIDNKNLVYVDPEIKLAALECKVPYIDLRDVLQSEKNIGEYSHPNDNGMVVISERIYSTLSAYLVKE